MKKAELVILSGPSGAGEDSIINELEKIMPVERVVTTTSREMREGEVQGNPYYFISKEEFEKGVDQGSFFEYAKEYNNNYYGVTKQEIERVMDCGRVGIWKIEYQGVKKAKELIPGIVAIYIKAPLEILEKRIRSRGNVSDEYVQQRMAYTREWMKHLHIYDFEVENEEGKLGEAVQKIKQIIEEIM